MGLYIPDTTCGISRLHIRAYAAAYRIDKKTGSFTTTHTLTRSRASMRAHLTPLQPRPSPYNLSDMNDRTRLYTAIHAAAYRYDATPPLDRILAFFQSVKIGRTSTTSRDLSYRSDRKQQRKESIQNVSNRFLIDFESIECKGIFHAIKPRRRAYRASHERKKARAPKPRPNKPRDCCISTVYYIFNPRGMRQPTAASRHPSENLLLDNLTKSHRLATPFLSQ